MKYSNGTLQKLRNWLPMISILTVTLLLATTGCSTDPIKSTDKSVESGSDNYFDRPNSDPNDFSLNGRRPFILNDAGTIVTQVAGGTVVADDPRFKLDVPAEAVSEPVMISVKVDAIQYGRQGTIFLLECGPDGLVFNTPATLEFDASVFGSASPKEDVSLYWYNPFTGFWELQEKVTVLESDDGTLPVELKIYHFSRYGVSD